jgi:hypothetical protein
VPVPGKLGFDTECWALEADSCSTAVQGSHASGPSLMTTLKPGSRFSEGSNRSSSSSRHTCQPPVQNLSSSILSNCASSKRHLTTQHTTDTPLLPHLA